MKGSYAKIVRKTCLNCDTPYNSGRRNQVYCSPICSDIAHNEKNLYSKTLSLRVYRFLQKTPGRLEALIEEMESSNALAKTQDKAEKKEARADVKGRQGEAPEEAHV